MVANGEAPARGSAAAAASIRRRRTSGAGAAAGANTMLQFYTDDTACRKMSPQHRSHHEHWVYCYRCRLTCLRQAVSCSQLVQEYSQIL
ncbi:hypothetical protein BHE74_00048136 [Ensete ventricosum]|uniref:Uncharacterized protein n=1 Tax=Ensete ventricosum TaxID=4639 RepID=A0A444DIV3_ENSVE|nr:hypothetical protein B296_00043966 [Ensete ventricosum]RWV98047.1 hypothetical protein GW17_00039127 [Ensete ventricosum]RWW45978.1 hypothetical protein BHE74_00048136 [Ensete ventricosum]RZS20405.1 hypothetical protein BHM03_00052911 [Ensete ventricosum]